MQKKGWSQFSKKIEWYLWTNVVNSSCEEEFNWRLSNLTEKSQSIPDFDAAVAYITSQWIPLRRYFGKCWVDEFTHFGSYTSQRVEGSHATLKNQKMSNMTLLEASERAIEVMLRSTEERRVDIEREKQCRLVKTVRDPIFNKLHGKESTVCSCNGT
ncbi:hypothetical protein GEMRC1_004840 [Eukaryota sp. GEM-RC1]